MNRKYRHSGYQDSDRDDDRPSRRSPPRTDLTQEEKIQRKSLRHAIDRDAREVVRCHSCGLNVPGMTAITHEATCPHCSVPLHCCRGCLEFDTAARWQCRAKIRGPVGDKNQPNECSEFRPRFVLDSTGRRSTRGGRNGSNDPRSQFENLFRR